VVTRKHAAVAAVTLLAVLGWLQRPAGGDATTLRAGTARQTVTLTVEHPRTGHTGFTIELAGHDGAPLAGAFIRVVTVMPLMVMPSPRGSPPQPRTAATSWPASTS
jgi:hypothetical protein